MFSEQPTFAIAFTLCFAQQAGDENIMIMCLRFLYLIHYFFELKFVPHCLCLDFNVVLRCLCFPFDLILRFCSLHFNYRFTRLSPCAWNFEYFHCHRRSVIIAHFYATQRCDLALASSPLVNVTPFINILCLVLHLLLYTRHLGPFT